MVGGLNNADVLPVGVELLGDKHRKRGLDTLAYFGFGGPNGDLAVGVDSEQRAGLEGRICLEPGRGRGNSKSQSSAADAQLDELAPGELSHPPPPPPTGRGGEP